MASAHTKLKDVMRTLIDEVIYSRRMVREGSFVANAASIELERVGITALPAVEEKLAGDITNIARESASHAGLSSRLSGIDDLLRYFLRVGLPSQPKRITEVISKFPPALLSAVLDVSCLAFKEVKGVSPQLEVPREFGALVTALATVENEEVRNSAKRAAAVFRRLNIWH